jgi:universal stress protein E
MQRFRKILVGVDLSQGDRLADVELAPASRQALRRAIWIAGHSRGELTIFAALDISEHAQAVLQQEIEHDPGDVEKQACDALDRFVAEAAAEGVQATRKLAFGTPWREICREALTAGHDFVVVGTRELGWTGRMLFGSTGMKLLRACPCPVMVTRPDPNWDDLNILVPSDFSEVSQEALAIAVEGAQLVDSRLHLLHALEGQIAPPQWFGAAQKKLVADYIAGQRAEAENKLREQLTKTDYRTLPRGVQVHVVDGPPDEAILHAVDEFQIDLVVMGTSARTGIAGLFTGNTAERLISHLTCSVIAVKPPGFECPISVDG